MPVPSSRASVRRIVPSPPTAIASWALSGSSTSSTPACSATPRTRSTACRTSIRPWATTAAVSTGECVLDPRVEVIGKRRLLGMDEVEEDLPVPLRPGQPRVYDAADGGLPGERGLRHLAHHPPPYLGIAHDAPLPHVLAPRLEL